MLLQNAVPAALKKAKPGTVEFRRALRDAIEGVKNQPAAHGIFNLTPNDHQGFDQRARVMVTIENGTWRGSGDGKKADRIYILDVVAGAGEPPTAATAALSSRERRGGCCGVTAA